MLYNNECLVQRRSLQKAVKDTVKQLSKDDNYIVLPLRRSRVFKSSTQTKDMSSTGV